MERTCEVFSCSIVSCQIGRKVGTSFFVEEKARVFTTNLSMSKFLSVFNERNYILPKNLQLRLFFTNLFSKRRQLCHFSGVYIRPCLCCTNRRRLVPGARFSKVPKTFRARKAICETANRLFWKADLLTCFQGK